MQLSIERHEIQSHFQNAGTTLDPREFNGKKNVIWPSFGDLETTNQNNNGGAVMSDKIDEINNKFGFTTTQQNLVKRVIECVAGDYTEETVIMFTKKGDIHEYNGREFTQYDTDDENYEFVDYNGYKIGENMQEVVLGNEIPFPDFVAGNYVISKYFCNFDMIAVKNIDFEPISDYCDVYTTPDDPGGWDTEIYYFE